MGGTVPGAGPFHLLHCGSWQGLRFLHRLAGGPEIGGDFRSRVEGRTLCARGRAGGRPEQRPSHRHHLLSISRGIRCPVRTRLGRGSWRGALCGGIVPGPQCLQVRAQLRRQLVFDRGPGHGLLRSRAWLGVLRGRCGPHQFTDAGGGIQHGSSLPTVPAKRGRRDPEAAGTPGSLRGIRYGVWP